MSDLQQSNDHANSVTNVLGEYLGNVAGINVPVASGTAIKVCFKLMSGLLNNTKYLPCGYTAGGGKRTLPLCRDKSPMQVMCC